MGLIIFAILMMSLITGQVKSIIKLKTTDDASDTSEDDYFDDFETLWFLIFVFSFMGLAPHVAVWRVHHYYYI